MEELPQKLSARLHSSKSYLCALSMRPEYEEMLP